MADARTCSQLVPRTLERGYRTIFIECKITLWLTYKVCY